MSRIPTPATIEAAPASAHASLHAVEKQLGSVPNMFRLIANSPATLSGYLGLSGALGHGTLDVKTRQRIAITVAQSNHCSYCLSAHTYLGKNLAKLDDAELAANREGGSSDAKADAALRFATKLVHERGQVGEADVQALLSAGYDHGQVLEIIAHVALNTFTNYVNEALGTEIDFPLVDANAR
jgi:uncharacterized peroxidase-related enzyme